MRCQKCGFVSFDYLSRCKRCAAELVQLRESLGFSDFRPEPVHWLRPYVEESAAGDGGAVLDSMLTAEASLAAVDGVEDLAFDLPLSSDGPPLPPAATMQRAAAAEELPQESPWLDEMDASIPLDILEDDDLVLELGAESRHAPDPGGRAAAAPEVGAARDHGGDLETPQDDALAGLSLEDLSLDLELSADLQQDAAGLVDSADRARAASGLTDPLVDDLDDLVIDLTNERGAS